MAASDEDKKREPAGPEIKVVDRRRFTSEGNVREGVPDEPVAAKPTPEQRAAPEPRGKRERPREPQPQPGPEGPIDFLSFVASLATNALAAMGALPDAKGLPQSPELAREYIEILAMLQNKTRGNLTADEAKSLQSILTELRLRFVELTGPARPAPTKR